MSEKEKGYRSGNNMGIADHLGNLTCDPIPKNGNHSPEYLEGYKDGYMTGWNSIAPDDYLFS